MTARCASSMLVTTLFLFLVTHAHAQGGKSPVGKKFAYIENFTQANGQPGQITTYVDFFSDGTLKFSNFDKKGDWNLNGTTLVFRRSTDKSYIIIEDFNANGPNFYRSNKFRYSILKPAD